MKAKIVLCCCALLLLALPAAWAEAPNASADCQKQTLLTSLQGPQSMETAALDNLSPLADAQQKAGNCCTPQDRIECFSNVPEGCYVEQFYCYQNWFCYCGYFCN